MAILSEIGDIKRFRDKEHLASYAGLVPRQFQSGNRDIKGHITKQGPSMKSERSAYDRAMDLLSSIGIEMDSIRLDRYYSSPSYVDKLGKTKVFIIPKKNSTLNGPQKWKSTMKNFVENTMPYLEEYHQRSNSESGFAADKKMLGWNIAQRRDDRIDNALFCTGIWHNLFNMGRS